MRTQTENLQKPVLNDFTRKIQEASTIDASTQYSNISNQDSGIRKFRQRSISLQTTNEVKSTYSLAKPSQANYSCQTDRSCLSEGQSKGSSCKIISSEDFERLESERKVLEKVLTQERNIAGLKLGVMQKKTDEVIADRAELIAENNDAKQKIAHLLNENDAYFDKIATLELRNEFLHRAMNELKSSIVE